MLQVSKIADIEPRVARERIQRVRAAISDWRRFASEADLSARSREAIAKALGLDPAKRRARVRRGRRPRAR